MNYLAPSMSWVIKHPYHNCLGDSRNYQPLGPEDHLMNSRHKLSASGESSSCIMKTRLLKYIENFISKNCKFSDKNSDIFFISAQNIDCGYSLEPPRRGGPNEYPQSMFLSRNKKNNVYPCKPQFYYTKVGFKGVKII